MGWSLSEILALSATDLFLFAARAIGRRGQRIQDQVEAIASLLDSDASRSLMRRVAAYVGADIVERSSEVVEQLKRIDDEVKTNFPWAFDREKRRHFMRRYGSRQVSRAVLLFGGD